MFESNEFLDCYLPQFLHQLVLRSKSRISHSQTCFQTLKTIIKFIKMSHQLYSSVSNPSSFQTFLLTLFPFLTQHHSSSTSSPTFINQHMHTLFTQIESKIDQASSNSLSLFVTLMFINSQLTSKKIQNQKKINFHNQLTQLSSKLRFTFQLLKIQGQTTLEFDEHLQYIMLQFVSIGISKDMQSILKGFVSHQNSNFSHKLTNFIHNLTTHEMHDLNQVLNDQNKAGRVCVQKVSADVGSMLRKNKPKKQKIVNKMDSPTGKNCHVGTKNRKKIREYSLSPMKQSNSKPRQLPSPAKRIQQMAKSTKAKPIQKKRTIYFERTNIHFKKNKDWIEKPQGLFSQTSIGSSERLNDLRNSRENIEVEQFDDEESILVRSTPKISRKLQMRVISHRLEF